MKYSETSTYVRSKQFEAETMFTKRAAEAVRSGKDWDSFVRDGNAEFSINSEWKDRFEQMSERAKDKAWTPDGELAALKQAQTAFVQDLNDHKFYMSIRDDLLKHAANNESWGEAKNRLGLNDTFEKYYRVAQDEAGVTQAQERPDPIDEAFAMGMGAF